MISLLAIVDVVSEANMSLIRLQLSTVTCTCGTEQAMKPALQNKDSVLQFSVFSDSKVSVHKQVQVFPEKFEQQYNI